MFFDVADDILIAGLGEQGKDHDATYDKVLRVCRQVNLKLNIGKCLFRCTSIQFIGEIMSWQDVSLDPRKVKVLIDMPPLKSKKQLQTFLGILKYLSNFSSVTAEVCKPL